MLKAFSFIGSVWVFFYGILANAAYITVTPINLYLDNATTLTNFSLKNDSDEVATLQINAKKWQQVKGKDVYTDTKDIVLSPVIFSIKPHSKQIIRLGLRQPLNNTSEATYRIITSELPVNSDSIGKTKKDTISVLLQIDMPLFIVPSAVVQNMSFQVKKKSANKVTVKFVNTGNVHAQITNLKLYDKNNCVADQSVSSRILAGQSGQAVLPLNKPLIDNQVNVVVTETNPDGQTREFNELVKVL